MSDLEDIIIDENGRKFKKVLMGNRIIEVEIDYKEVIITPEEANRIIKEYEDKVEEERKKAHEEYYKMLEKVQEVKVEEEVKEE